MKAYRFAIAVLALSVVIACEAQDPDPAAAPGNGAGPMAVGDEGEASGEEADDPAAAKPLPWGKPYQPAEKKSDGEGAAAQSPEAQSDSPEKSTYVFPDPWAWCKVKITPADGSFAQKDTCWNPPSQWCASGGYSGAFTDACSPDGQTCCEFGSGCIPCGWIKCNDGYGNCPKALDGKAVCEQYRPRTICLDEYLARPR